jgi:hypothetical protein
VSLTLSRPKEGRRGKGGGKQGRANDGGTSAASRAAGANRRRVRRVIRKVDAWTVFKVSALFYASLLVVWLVAGVVLWLAASVTGVMDNVDTFIAKLFALQSFHFSVTQVLRGSVLGGLVLVVLGTCINVVGAVLYNLIADVVGGVEITVLEEEPTR